MKQIWWKHPSCIDPKNPNLDGFDFQGANREKALVHPLKSILPQCQNP